MLEPALLQLIEPGIATEAPVVNVMVSRFADHLALLRQAQIIAGQGETIAKATIIRRELLCNLELIWYKNFCFMRLG